jgi:FixJ family two-component response regulator
MKVQQISISIVDDDASLRRAARRLVKSYGFTVETFASAEDFLASSCLRVTACLVLDVHMPGLSGLQLQSRLLERGHHIPIIFITAHADERMRAEAMRAGAVCYLLKPFEEAELLNCIGFALRGSSSLTVPHYH